ISTAINRIVDLRGGIVIADGNEVSELALPIGGLMSPLDGPTVARLYSSLKQRATSQGCTLNAPFMTMAFMSLPVIPDIKLTDKGLFDTIHFEFTPLFE
ncbi:MAG: adenine deaminase, partial [Bacteroidales bacterium]|nr:adenine deaminase [Candidatus Sodaliphilus aphodohippi]